MNSTKERRVLLLEDSEEDYLLASRMLRGTSFEITWIQSLGEAWTESARARFDAILLDLDVLDSFGLDTLDQVRTRMFDTPIVVLTGYDNDDRAIKALQLGAQDYIVKNRVTADRLLSSLRYAMERHQIDRKLRWLIRKLVAVNDRLIQTKDLALEDLRKSRELIAQMSHELRTPLGAVVAISELLTMEPLEAEAKSLTEKLFVAAQKMALVINNRLDFSRLCGRNEPEIATCSVKEIIDDVVEIVRPIAARKGVALQVSCCDGLPDVIKTDPVRLQQAILNFAHNAAKFTARGVVRVEAVVSESDLKIIVSDTGVGIPIDAQGKIFEPFKRKEQSSVARYGGSGNGLMIAKRSIELLGGKVGFSSQLGKGSSFWLTVPMCVS